MWHQRSRHTQSFVVPHHKPEQTIIVWKDVMFGKMFQRFGVERVRFMLVMFSKKSRLHWSQQQFSKVTLFTTYALLDQCCIA
jgi:hypothetical protein